MIFDGMCWEGGLQAKVDEIGKKDVDWIDSYVDFFPCVVELPKPTHECAEPQPLAAALQYSRDLRKRKERDSDDWLDAREVVKLQGVKKPKHHKEPTYELKEKKEKPKPVSAAIKLRRKREAMRRKRAKKATAAKKK